MSTDLERLVGTLRVRDSRSASSTEPESRPSLPESKPNVIAGQRPAM